MNDRLYGTIETQITENNEISTVLYGNNQQITTYTSDVPQIQTIIQAGYMPIVSVINAPFIEVTSVNGMTGDVITEPIVKGFEPNHYYLKDTIISRSGKLYSANETFTSGEYFNGDDWTEVSGGGESRPAYDKIQKIKNYLFETWYSNLDYTNAKEYFQSKKPTVGGACTSIRKGKFFARNYDWTYDENAEFIIRTPRANGYYATMGIGGSIAGLTDAVVTAGEPNELYKLVPFFLQDGINEFGLTVSTNVTPNQHGNNNYVNPTGTVREEICSIMLPRYILDHYQTATEAVADIQEHLKIFTPKTLGQMGYDQQYLIADENETYVLEFNEGGYEIVEHNFITNFYIADVNFNPDGSVWTPADVPTHLPSSNNLTTHAMGLERYNLVNNRYASLSTKQDFINLLSDLYYTKCYTTAPVVSSPFWFTECIYGDLTVDSPTSEFNHVVSVMAQRYTDRSRTDGGLTWQTVHSSLYDMDEKKLYLRVQEESGDTEYVFDFFYTAREVDNLLEGKVDKVAGKGLSTNDYTTTEKTKLNGVESGAQKNVQSNWTQTNTAADDYIKNKPTIPTVNNATLTIQKNGSSVGTFTANASANKSINITTPTKASDLTYDILDKIYPVGSIYMSATLSTPTQVKNALGGGTWVAWGAGRVPIGMGNNGTTNYTTVEATGGEETHTLTINEMPNHSHAIHSGYGEGSGGSDAYRYQFWASSNLGWHENNNNISLRRTGGGQAHNNLQPYITCYMYKRTA